MPPATPRIITLLTDFGHQDPFVGVMKGVIAGIAPKAQVIDLCHEVQPFHIGQARFLLSQSRGYFPPKTIHLVVVDPGVGTERRPLVVEAGGQFFIGPDNGVFTDVLELPKARARQIANLEYHLKNVSVTFHGRDIFAPAAAHLASGVTPSKFGPQVNDPVRLALGRPVRTGKRFWVGEVAHIDRFGNLITNLPVAEFPTLAQRGCVVKVGLEAIEGPSPNYASGSPGEPLVVVGSSGHLEIAVNQGRADRKLGVAIGSPVELEVL